MTVEEKWFACRDVWDIINKYLPSHLRETKDGERKLQLFACACCRRQWQHIEGTPAAGAIEVIERFADGQASLKELSDAHDAAEQRQNATYVYRATEIQPEYPAHYTATACAQAATNPATYEYSGVARAAAIYTAQAAAYVKRGFYRIPDPVWDKYIAQENAAQTVLFREIFGNPFRPTVIDPEWRTTTVMQLAKGIYDNRDYATMPILADALQDAGCTADELLKHFRDTKATHVRGCWALDVVLGKE